MPADDVIHELPMRWADLDVLNHVNNVVYVDYAAESLAMLSQDGLVGVGERVSRVAVDFRRPLLLSSRPVVVASSRAGDRLVQEVCHLDGDDRVVFARVETTFGEHELPEPGPQSIITPYPLRVRRSDIDETGSARVARVFEFFQEARVLLLARLDDDGGSAGRYVVGRVDVTYGRPIGWRREDYQVRTWIDQIGTSSMTLESELADGEEVLAHATTVLVGFDRETQRSRRLSPHERSVLEAFVPD